MNGLVISLQGGLYKVKYNNSFYFCKGRGNLRYKNTSPVVGDYVKITILDKEKDTGVIESIEERKNYMTRPNVANVDNAIIVSSIHEPYLNDYIIDKMLMLVEYKGINPILVFTKMDLIEKTKKEEVLEKIEMYQKIGYEVYLVDNSTSGGVKEFSSALSKNSISVITGQTGVGKTTIINNINANLDLNTGETSKSLGRGKHTTRHSEMHELLPDVFIIDTPGFSSFLSEGINLDNINYITRDFKQYINKCKFNNCMHINEPGCYIKQMIEEGSFYKRRYTNYLKIVNEIKENERK
ncbi:MAG: ribosome small subunit-dependent GTPase A [Mycoplasmataceae bacterium]|nr:ribosome small subunit-dependent GTPase A [Mycoplasmataceae bacterium]